MTIPTTCPDFVSHPHLIEGRNCYTCVASLCSEEQGTSAIAEALITLGIPADVHQTKDFLSTKMQSVKAGQVFILQSLKQLQNKKQRQFKSQ